MSSTETEQMTAIDRVLQGLDKVRVMICSNNYSIIGQVYYSREERFLDTLNKGLIIQKQRTKNILILDQALLVKPDGQKEKIPGLCFVSKESIVFIGTFDKTRASTSESINAVRAYPWRKKDKVSVKMVFAGKYRLVGHIHNDPWVLPVSSFESADDFLPMTDTTVISSLEPEEIHFDFVAINKKQIFLIQVSQ